MIDWKERKELKEQLEVLRKDYWQLVSPMSDTDIFSKNPFIHGLQKLTNSASNFSSACRQVELFAEKFPDDKKNLQDLEDTELQEEVEFYALFNEFVKKYSSESSRVHSAMGAKTSELKKRTSAENGKKGGRPRKNPSSSSAGRTRTGCNKTITTQHNEQK